jgi:hypothetical protein
MSEFSQYRDLSRYYSANSISYGQASALYRRARAREGIMGLESDAMHKLQCAYDILGRSIPIDKIHSIEEFFEIACVILETFGVNGLQPAQSAKPILSPDEAIARLLAANDKQGISEIDVLRNAGYTITVSDGIASDGRPGTVISITNPKK